MSEKYEQWVNEKKTMMMIIMILETIAMTTIILMKVVEKVFLVVNVQIMGAMPTLVINYNKPINDKTNEKNKGRTANKVYMP